MRIVTMTCTVDEVRLNEEQHTRRMKGAIRLLTETGSFFWLKVPAYIARRLMVREDRTRVTLIVEEA